MPDGSIVPRQAPEGAPRERPLVTYGARDGDLPDVPVLSADLRQAIDRGVKERRMVFPEGREARVVEIWNPVKLPREVIEECDEHVAALRNILEPAKPKVVLARILTLLSHYGGDAKSPEVEQAMARDWADDVGEYPSWALDAAARRWRRTQKFRPRISEIRGFCEEIVDPHRRILARLTACRTATPNSAEAEVMSRRVAEISHGLFQRVPR